MARKFDPEKFYGKVFDLLDEDDYSGALKLLETVPQAHIKKNEHHGITALCYYYLNEEKKALDHLNKISSKFRKDPDYQFLKAECHYYLGRDKDLDPAIQAYSNAIELYESDPKSLEWFGEEVMTISRSKILSRMVIKGMNEFNENNLKSVQESLDYIMEHHSDCTDEDFFGGTGVFLVICAQSDEFSDRKEDYIDLSIVSLEKAIKKCRKNSKDLPFSKNMLGWAYSLSGINAIEKGDISSIKKMSEKIIGMDLTLSDNYSAYLDIGTFLGSCYHIKDFLETDEQYLLNAQTFLSECQKSDVKDIKNSAILFLGMLSVEKESDIRNTIRGLKFDDEFLNDNYIFIQTLLDLDKKPQSVIRALNNLKERKNIPELLINYFLVIAYWEADKKNKAKKLLTEIKREDFSNYFHLLPHFDLACCVILNSSEAKVHLEEWVEQYPDSERFKGYLSNATNKKNRNQFTNMIPIEDLMSFISPYMYSGDKQNIESKMLGSKKPRGKNKGVVSVNFKSFSNSVNQIKQLNFTAEENHVEFLFSHSTKLIIKYDRPKFWLFWYLAKEYESEDKEKPWLQFPEKHLDIIDEIWIKWHGVKFIDHLTGLISDHFGSDHLPRVKTKEDLNTFICKWDNKFFEYFYQLPGDKHKSWVLDIKGSNRRNIKSEIIKPLNDYLKDNHNLFKSVPSTIKNRPSPFKINTSLDIKISFIE
jgi:tetratricopeptide (TPR) repeat protein